jgi:AraC-like DNA-binding protein
MFVYAYCITAYLLIVSGEISKVPFLYKTAAPLNLLLAPTSFLYVRSVLKNEKKIAYLDLLHLIPFVIFAISYLPFYFISGPEKTLIVKKVVANFSAIYVSNDGIIPEKIFHYFHPLQRLIYNFFELRLILIAQQNKEFFVTHTHFKTVIKWLKFFVLSRTISVLSIIIASGLIMYSNQKIENELNLSLLITSSSVFCFSIYLLLNPEVLYGIPFITSKKNGSPSEISKEDKKLIIHLYAKEIHKIENAFKTDSIFLQSNFNINKLAVILEIPSKNLSFIINNHYNQRFTDFLNMHRINYIIAKMKGEYLEKYTLESLSLEAGFINKATFNSAFKKHMKCTPSEYLAQKTR